MTDPITIPGAPHNPYREITGIRYDYDHKRSECAWCGGVGIPWLGWFTCQDCRAVALVGDGHVFVPVDSMHKLGARGGVAPWLIYPR